MNIETKYNIGEKVFIIVDNRITQAVVLKIEIVIEKRIHQIRYGLRWSEEKYSEKHQDEVYKTKLEIIQ